MSARRTAPNWSLERSIIKADRAKRVSLTLNWTQTENSFGDLVWLGRDADNVTCASVALVGDQFVAWAYVPGTLDLIRVGEFSRSTGCMALGKAKAAAEAAYASHSALVSEAA
jgi:hypothetical protein